VDWRRLLGRPDSVFRNQAARLGVFLRTVCVWHIYRSVTSVAHRDRFTALTKPAQGAGTAAMSRWLPLKAGTINHHIDPASSPIALAKPAGGIRFDLMC